MAGMKECFQRGLQLGDTLTDFFSQQTKTEGIIIMEMEKACWPFLNWPEKKRYVSRYYEHPDGKPKIDAKGVQLVRRDGAPILPRLYKEVVDCIMPLEGGVKGSTVLSAEVTAIIESMLRRIAEDKIPLEDSLHRQVLLQHVQEQQHAARPGGREDPGSASSRA